MILHVLLSDDTNSWQNLDNLSHHISLLGIDRPCEEEEASLVLQDPLEAILKTKRYFNVLQLVKIETFCLIPLNFKSNTMNPLCMDKFMLSSPERAN